MPRQRLMAVVEYDGTNYRGFQAQREGATIQGEIEQALATITQERIRVVAAGRTDAGVHARGQVVHFVTAWRHPLEDLQRALNAVLSKDVAILELRAVSPDFHARRDARSRVYVYSVYDSKVRSPVLGRFSHHCERALDVEAMNQACQCLVGEQDFGPFGWAPGSERGYVGRRGTVRRVLRVECARQGELVKVTIEADAFLRSMVRRVVGNLLLVGRSDLSGDEFAALLDLKHRRLPAGAAPACGLCLVRVNY